MKHLSTAALGLSVAVVAAAAIAQTQPPETPAATNARKQSGTVGSSPDAAPVANPASHAESAGTPASAAPAATTTPAASPAPALAPEDPPAPATRPRTSRPAEQSSTGNDNHDGEAAHAPARRLPKRPDRN